MEEQIREYRREAVRLLAYISERMNKIDDSHYNIMGDIPAFPEEYEKSEWERARGAICNEIETIKDDLKTAKKEFPSNKFQYELFIGLIESINWEEI